MPEPSNIRFPGKRTESVGNLSLRRTRPTASPFTVTEAMASSRESIRALVSATRPPSGGRAVDDARAAELEKSLRQLELKLVERERIVQDKEVRLREYEREMAEAEALLAAREQLVAAARKSTTTVHVSPEEKTALEGLRAELERQEAALKDAQAALHERERFMEDSETRLFEKVQSQQEREIELDQREEELKARVRKNRENEAAVDPTAAATLKAEDAEAADSDEMRA
jgi:chromosome segregation ATPase